MTLPTTTTSITPTTISLLMKTLCELSTKVQHDMCSILSKSTFNDIKVSDVCGSGKTKVSKQYLFETVSKLTKDIAILDKSINPVFECETLSDALNNICNTKTVNTNQFMTDINNQISNNTGKLTSIETQLSVLSDAIKNFKVPLSSSEVTHSEPLVPPATTEQVSHKVKHIDENVDNFITSDESFHLLESLSQEDFSTEGNRGVATYGASYNYMGSKSQPKPLPDCLKNLMDKLNQTKTSGKYELNQCLVNRYDGPDATLPEHSDDEYAINPSSDIFTISIGAARTMVFRDIISGVEVEHTPQPDSLYVMSRDSQNFYKHRIDSESSTSGVRYSITFRCVHWKYLNSTCIIGDSNTKKITFGVGKGTVGESTPGNQVLAYTVEEIDPSCCASYKNVVIVVGTNNLRSRNVNNFNDVKNIYSMYKGKILEIKKLNKRCNIFIVPVLPTKLINVNRKITDFNGLIFRDLPQSCDNVSFIDVSQFVDRRNGLLLESLSRSSEDPLHISSSGVGILVRLIKTCIFQRKRSSKIHSSRSLSSIVSGHPDDDSH